MHVPYDAIIEKIKESTSLSRQEIEDQINKKMQQLTGLLTKEGAAHIIANQHGVSLVPDTNQPITINQLIEDLKGVSLNAKVVSVSPVRTFQRKDRKGQVCNITIGDHTGTTRVVFWNNEVDKIKDIKPDVTYEFSALSTRTNNGALELVSTSKTTITPSNNPVETIPKATYAQHWIKDLQPNARTQITGIILQSYSPHYFKNKEQDSCVQNAVVDDGTGNIRVAFFGQTMADLWETKAESIYKDKPDKRPVGMYVKISGRVSHNTQFDRMEMVADSLDVIKDPEKLLDITQE